MQDGPPENVNSLSIGSTHKIHKNQRKLKKYIEYTQKNMVSAMNVA